MTTLAIFARQTQKTMTDVAIACFIVFSQLIIVRTTIANITMKIVVY